jgi:hypothetical protein
VRRDVEQKFSMSVDGVFLGGELSKVRRMVALPNMVTPLDIETVKQFFEDQAKQLAGEVLEQDSTPQKNRHSAGFYVVSGSRESNPAFTVPRLPAP